MTPGWRDHPGGLTGGERCSSGAEAMEEAVRSALRPEAGEWDTLGLA